MSDLDLILSQIQDDSAARLRMRSPRAIENLIAHVRDGKCGGEPRCWEDIVKVLEWVLNRATPDDSLAQGLRPQTAAGKDTA